MHTFEQPGYAEHDKPHPIVGRMALAAIVLAMLAIAWAKIEILGLSDIECPVAKEDATPAQACIDQLRALAYRWVTGFWQ